MNRNAMLCSRCGKELSHDTIVCAGCGKKVKKLKTFYYPKNWLMTLALCIAFGSCGAHRFYTGHIGTGILQLLTFGGLGFWTLTDISSILCNTYKDAEGIELFL